MRGSKEQRSVRRKGEEEMWRAERDGMHPKLFFFVLVISSQGLRHDMEVNRGPIHKMALFHSKVQYKSLENWHRGGERERETGQCLREKEKGRPITNAKNKKPERTAANPIRIPSKNPPNCLPHLQEQEQQESILVGGK